MEMNVWIVFAAVGLFAGAVGAGWGVALRGKLENAAARIDGYETLLAEWRERFARKEEELLDYRKGFEELVNKNGEKERECAVLQTRIEGMERSHAEKIALLEEAKTNLKTQFENLANQIFEQKSKHFEEQHQKGLDLFLKPFREQISQFAQQAQQRHVEEVKERHLLKDEILRLKQLNERIGQDAINLTNALKGENKTQGNWGEIVLEKILEESGLREGHEYTLQSTLKDGEGRVLRPDVVVHLPQNKDIVVDSKVSLVAYERFMNAVEPEEKTQALKAHLQSIHAHIKGLGNKRYESLDGVRTLDFVLLFMPIEGAFLLALEQDSTFFRTAFENNIMVVGPSTLLVTLRTIEHIWRTERQEQHAQEIVRQAENLYDKLALFVEDMQRIGDQLGKTQDSYDKAMNKLSTGKGNLIRRAEQMKELGLKPKKSLPATAETDDSAE